MEEERAEENLSLCLLALPSPCLRLRGKGGEEEGVGFERRVRRRISGDEYLVGRVSFFGHRFYEACEILAGILFVIGMRIKFSIHDQRYRSNKHSFSLS